MPDRDNVLKGLKACADGECTNCPYDKGAALMTTCTGKLSKDALALLKAQEEQIESLKQTAQSMMEGVCLLKEQEAVGQKWISVKERYPEKEGFYLVSADHGNYHPWIAEMRIFKGIKGFYNGAVMPCVGAWMPLPKPYKEGR